VHDAVRENHNVGAEFAKSMQPDFIARIFPLKPRAFTSSSTARQSLDPAWRTPTALFSRMFVQT